MTHYMRYLLGLAGAGLILVAASTQPASAAQPGAPFRPGVPSAPVRPNPLPLDRPTVSPPSIGTRPLGEDWWRTYPWSPYNAWKNPYWYPPYNNNYPYPPDQAYPNNPYPVPRPYPVLPPAPSSWGGFGYGPR
jgi:hypothetical protein